jgi:membrane protein YqaA with SNARE-associated domain
MPRSKSRKHHHQQQHHPSVAKEQAKKNRLLIVTIIFLALLGIGIAWFASGNNLLVLALGALIGGVCGYFFGKLIESSLAKK